MKATKCPNCGANLDPSRSSCEYCGTIFSDPSETTKVDLSFDYRDLGGNGTAYRMAENLRRLAATGLVMRG